MKPVYKRMLDSMRLKESRRRKHTPKDPWVLYILKCNDGTLYTGIAKDLQKRFQTHNSGKGAKYTRTRLPLELLYQEACKNRTQALIREYAVKSLSRKKKETLILSGSHSAQKRKKT